MADRRFSWIVKHALFAPQYGGGTIWMWSLVR